MKAPIHPTDIPLANTEFDHRFDFVLPEVDLDTFGHMNHAHYLKWFEQARWDWIHSGGFGLDVIHQKKIGPTILALQIQYKREIKARDKITIQSRCLEYRGKIGKVHQRMIRDTHTICAEIELTVALFDMNTRKLIAPTEEWLKAIRYNNYKKE